MAEKQTKYLLVWQERRDEYMHLYARVVTDRYERGERWPWGLDDDYDYKGLLYSGLRVACQGDARSQTRDHEPVYGFHIEYCDLFSVDREKAGRMHKTLTLIAKRLEKLGASRGYYRSYGEYLGRIAEVLGCAGIVIDRQTTKVAQDSYSRYRWESVGDGVNTVNHLVLLWQREAQPETQEQAS